MQPRDWVKDRGGARLSSEYLSGFKVEWKENKVGMMRKAGTETRVRKLRQKRWEIGSAEGRKGGKGGGGKSGQSMRKNRGWWRREFRSRIVDWSGEGSPLVQKKISGRMVGKKISGRRSVKGGTSVKRPKLGRGWKICIRSSGREKSLKCRRKSKVVGQPVQLSGGRKKALRSWSQLKKP